MSRLLLWSAPALKQVPLLLCLRFTCIAHADEFRDVRRLHESGQTTLALVRADQYLAGKPRDPRMSFFKGVMFADTQRAAEAIELFSQITEDYPGLAEPYNNLAALHAASGQYDKARVTLEQALRINPDYGTAHQNLGDVYAMLANLSYVQALRLDSDQAYALLPKLALVRELLTPNPAAAAARRLNR